MKIDEFMEETKKLENFYGKELTEEQKTIWFENLNKISLERYRCIIGALYRKNKYFPSLADIIQLNDELGMKTWRDFAVATRKHQSPCAT